MQIFFFFGADDKLKERTRWHTHPAGSPGRGLSRCPPQQQPRLPSSSWPSVPFSGCLALALSGPCFLSSSTDCLCDQKEEEEKDKTGMKCDMPAMVTPGAPTSASSQEVKGWIHTASPECASGCRQEMLPIHPSRRT